MPGANGFRLTLLACDSQPVLQGFLAPVDWGR